MANNRGDGARGEQVSGNSAVCSRFLQIRNCFRKRNLLTKNKLLRGQAGGPRWEELVSCCGFGRLGGVGRTYKDRVVAAGCYSCGTTGRGRGWLVANLRCSASPSPARASAAAQGRPGVLQEELSQARGSTVRREGPREGERPGPARPLPRSGPQLGVGLGTRHGNSWADAVSQTSLSALGLR